MNQQKQLIALKLATPESTELSFCKPSVRSLAAWLKQLPKANTGEFSRQLYQALTELNKLKATPELRLQLFELLRPEVMQLANQLENAYLLNNTILDNRANKIANLCLALQHNLNNGYKRVVADSQQRKSSILALAVQRSIHGLFQALVRAYVTYRTPPAGLWYELHQLYGLAWIHRIQQVKIKDPLLNQQQSIEEAYCCALLLGCARANQMRQGDIKTLSAALPDWATMVRLQDIEAASSLFVVALSSDTPPRYKALLNLQGHSHLMGLNTSQLVNTLQSTAKAIAESGEQHPPAPGEVTLPLLMQLTSAWGDIAKRDFNRVSSKGNVGICIGMSAVHYHLSGRQRFEDTLTLGPEVAERFSVAFDTPDTPEETDDAWSRADDAGPNDLHVHSNEPINYELPMTEAEKQRASLDVHSLYPKLTADIVNQSPGGYCLEWAEDAPSNLQTGDIIAIQASTVTNWAIALVRWLRQNTAGGAKIGVELLAAKVEPCGVQLLRSGKPASSYLRGLRIPEIPAIARPQQLILPKVPFKVGVSININCMGVETPALLLRLTQEASSCNQYEYKDTTPAPTFEEQQAEASKGTEDSATPKVEPDEFKTLWQSL